MAICPQFKFLCSTEIFARYRQLLPTVHLFRYSKFIIRDKKKRKNLPSSHFSPLHCGLHEQAKASFSLSNKQEPPLRHPAIRQPCRKSHFTWVSIRCFPSTSCSFLYQQMFFWTYGSLKILFKAQCKSYLYNIYFQLRNQNTISINYKLDRLALNF